MTNNPETEQALVTVTQYALLPCPWCGTTEHLTLSKCGSLTGDMPDRPYKVLCTHIDHDTVEGPVAYGRSAAIAAWNHREQAQRPGSVAEEWDVYMTDAVSNSPEPLRQLGAHLAGLLDEDRWKTAERYLNAAVLAQRTEPSAGEVERVEVKKIETVTGDFLTEPGTPFWRIELDGYCADFDYEEAANNFAAAIQAMRGGQGERVGVLVPGYTEAADAIERGDFLPGEGIHPARGV